MLSTSHSFFSGPSIPGGPFLAISTHTPMRLTAASTLMLSMTGVRRSPLVAARSLVSMSSGDLPGFVKGMWSEMFEAGKSKDAAKIASTMDKYFKPDCAMIRPSGNPLDMDGFKGMLGSPDVIMSRDEVISVDDVKEIAGGNAAVVVYTTRSTFTYQGNANDDCAKFSATLEKVGEAWMVAHLHRGTGQPPAE